MATIKELDKAIETIRKECKAHDKCNTCPMYFNCKKKVPFEWDTIEVGDSDEAD